MPSCEKCWRDSGGNPARYRAMLKSRNCTPEQQAGAHATVCPKCKRKTIHQHVGTCTNPDCREEAPDGSKDIQD